MSQLPQDKIDELREVFQLLDRAKAGKISVQDFCIAMRALGHNPTEAALRDYARTAVDSDGLVPWESFLQAMTKQLVGSPAKDQKEELLEAFRVFDPENSGFIHTGELRHILTTLGEKLTEAEADEMVAIADPRNSGEVRYPDLVDKIMGA